MQQKYYDEAFFHFNGYYRFNAYGTRSLRMHIGICAWNGWVTWAKWKKCRRNNGREAREKKANCKIHIVFGEKTFLAQTQTDAKSKENGENTDEQKDGVRAQQGSS